MSASQFPIFSVSVDPHVRWHQLEGWQPLAILLPGAEEQPSALNSRGRQWTAVVCLQTLSPPPTPSIGEQSPSVHCGRWGPIPICFPPHGWEL